MKKLDIKELILPVIALFVICLVSAFLLAGTNSVTSGKIAENSEKQEIESRKIVFSSAAGFMGGADLDVGGREVKYCIAVDGAGGKIGYVFTSTNKGYGGDVTVMTAVDLNGTVLKSVVLSMEDETPGLGQNVGKDEFLDKFNGKRGPFSWVKNSGSGNEISGVTSATFTSKAVIACVNDALEAFRMIGGAA